MANSGKREKFGLLGKSLSHSYSPIIHAELAKETYLYDYSIFEKKEDELDEFLTKGDFKGLNVTIPYKKTVIPFCKSFSDAALATGSVNTIVKKSDEEEPHGIFLYGDNTDCYGFSYLLNKIEKKLNINLSGGKALIFGDGGSSLAVRTVLSQMGYEKIIIVSRKGPVFYDNVYEHSDAALIINTTPLGMFPKTGESPVESLRVFNNCKAIIDLIYNPAKTELLLMAEAEGIPGFNGLSMLVAQAKRSSEIFTDSIINDGLIEGICAKISSITQNIILIGMPGCGKTSIGRTLAELMNRKFIDIDEYIANKESREVKDIITNEGEEYFRRLETEALTAICKESSLVIASGGGVVTQEVNKNILRQNGIIFYIDRDISELSLEGRPLSLKEGLNALAKIRLPLYSEWSDYTTKVTEIKETAIKIKKSFDEKWK